MSQSMSSPGSQPKRRYTSPTAHLASIRPESTEDLFGPFSALEKMHAPDQLYVSGDRALLKRSPRVSIVGSRKASDEGLRRASKLARLLVDNGVVVVSGLADGIDTAAHRSAIDAKGQTIAVIGTPLDQVYPRSNGSLQAEIASRHLLVSQFAPGSAVRRHFFPQRNRTMALIVDASVIVEAGDTSGSLSQGWEALRLGRQLFIMRSILERADLSWPSDMLGYGALILEDLDPLLELLPASDHASADIPF